MNPAAHEEGRSAAAAGQDVTACPYPPHTDDAAAWQRGWGLAAGAVPLDLARRRVAQRMEATEPHPTPADPVDARPLHEWPEPLRSRILARLRTPRHDRPGWCRWCGKGVHVPHAERVGRSGDPEYRRVRPYKTEASLARHETDCWRNPDARQYVEDGRGFTCSVDGQMRGWYSAPWALEDMRRTMGHLRGALDT